MSNDELKPLDYVVLGLIRNGIRKFQSLQKRLTKTGQRKVTSSFNKLRKLGYVENHPDDGWLDRNLNPTLVLSDKGKKEVETKIDQLKQEWNNLVLLYENKDKEKLRDGMDSNRTFFPFMMLMGITNGMMFGSMLGMNQMMMGDYMQDSYDQGYADGMGDDGFMDGGGEGGFVDGGGEGGFMDGGMDVGF